MENINILEMASNMVFKIKSTLLLVSSASPLDLFLKNIHENRINIPILVGIDVFRKRISFFGGPTFNFVSDVFFDENNLKESISDLYSKSLLTLQYGASLNFNKLSFDFRIDKGFGDREIVYAEQLLGENKNQIVKTDGLLTMISVSYKF